MEKLMILDQKDYNETMPVFERYGSRAIIVKDNLIALQKGSNGEYKFPGGGIEEGETKVEALIREVQEEVGLVVIEESVKELGEVIEMRKDVKNENQKYICYSYYYSCSVKDETVECNRSQSEVERDFRLAWVDIKEAYESNLKVLNEESRMRDTKFLKLILEGVVNI